MSNLEIPPIDRMGTYQKLKNASRFVMQYYRLFRLNLLCPLEPGETRASSAVRICGDFDTTVLHAVN